MKKQHFEALRLGAFIVFTLLILSAGIFWIGSKQFLFSSTYPLSADFQNVAGLNTGADVRVGGIHQGTVKRIDLPAKPDEKVRVWMDLKGKTRNVIKKDSVAGIRSEGLIGDRYIEISFGSNEAGNVKDGDTIRSEPPLEISGLMKKADAILDSAQGAMENAVGVTNHLKDISAKINHGTGTMGALINDRKMYENVNAGATAFQEDMEALKDNFFLKGFFKNRGYKDSKELTKHAIPRLPSMPSSQHFIYDASKMFDKPDNAKLKKEKALNDAGKYLESNPFGLAVVAAYEDMKGDTQKDRILTQARAMVVRDYLIQNFKLDDTRIKTIGLGKTKGEDGGKVEILVYPAGSKL